MPLILEPEEEQMLAALKAQQGLVVGEVLKASWGTGAKYYGSTKLDELPNFRSILEFIPDGIELRLPGRSFPNVVLAADVSDEKINLNFSDMDGEITRLFRLNRGGVKVELLYYFPQLKWLVPHWSGFMQPPTEVDRVDFNCSASSGWRSAGLPLPHRMYQSRCQNQYPPHAGLLTQAEIDESGCPVNRHIGGTIGNIDPTTGEVYAQCKRDETDCNKIVGDTKSITGFRTSVAAVAIGQHNGTTFAPSRGNETNLKLPIRVVYGERFVRALDILALRQEANTSHPESGFLAALCFGIEGPIEDMSLCAINNSYVGAEHLNIRLGNNRQPATAYAPDVPNFSYTAGFFGRIGPLNPASYNASNTSAQCKVKGLKIRVYTSPTQFVERYDFKRIWCLLDLYRKWRYGHGVPVSRFKLQDWIEIAASEEESVSFTDPFGTVWTGPRNDFHAELQGRSAQEQIKDVCLWGRYQMPFQYLGKTRILRLTKESLENVPVFTDEGPERNILRNRLDEPKPGMSRVFWSQQSDATVPNELLITFDDAANGNIERPITIGDEIQQLKAGEALGETTLRIVRKTYSALGVTNLAQVIRTGWLLYWLGEFDTGGTKNNFRVWFFTTFQAGFGLYPGQVIKLDVELIRRASLGLAGDGGSFEYFRVTKKTRQSDLSYEVEVQAYPVDVYENLETILPSASDDYEAEAEVNTLTGDAVVALDPQCSNGAKVIGIGNGSTLRFNNIVVSTSRLYEMTVQYKSTANLTAFVSVNGGAAEPADFPDSGGEIAELTFAIGRLNAGTPQTITFSNPNAPCPDLDKIRFAPIVIEPHDPGGTVCRAQIGEVTYQNRELRIPIMPCQ